MPDHDPHFDVRPSTAPLNADDCSPSVGSAIRAPRHGHQRTVTAWFMDTYSMDPGRTAPEMVAVSWGAKVQLGRPQPKAALGLEKRKDILVIS